MYKNTEVTKRRFFSFKIFIIFSYFQHSFFTF